jgi:hypothetical protein
VPPDPSAKPAPALPPRPLPGDPASGASEEASTFTPPALQAPHTAAKAAAATKHGPPRISPTVDRTNTVLQYESQKDMTICSPAAPCGGTSASKAPGIVRLRRSSPADAGRAVGWQTFEQQSEATWHAKPGITQETMRWQASLIHARPLQHEK